MMNIAFDLISDLHTDAEPQRFDWTGQPTALYCVVAGDVARDRTAVAETIRHLAQRYAGVFVIDGNEEHRDYYDCLNDSYAQLHYEFDKIPGVVYLQNNVVIINGVAFIGTNGWWCYTFSDDYEFDDAVDWMSDYTGVTRLEALMIAQKAYEDAAYLVNTVSRLQRHPDVKKIVIISHTVPCPSLTNHDINLTDHVRYSCVGNQHLVACLDEDKEHKISTWCFGHYHLPIDQDVRGVRFVSNPRGRYDTAWYNGAYHPLRIEV